MRLSAPKKNTFYVAVILFALSVLGFWVAFLGAYQLWLAFAAFIILAAGNYFKGF